MSEGSTKNDKHLSRRSFLKTAAALGAGAGIVSACAPKVVETPVPTPDSTQPPAETKSDTPSYLIPPAPISAGQIKETVDADVVVVGAGMSGCCAALAAQQSGAKVAVLQKGPMVLTNGAGVAAWNSKVQKENGIEFDVQQAINEWMLDSGNYPDRSVVKVWIDHSGETIDWIIENVGDKAGQPIPPPNAKETYEDDYTKAYPTAHMWIPGVIVVAQALADKAMELGAKFYFNTPGVQLIRKDGGRVTGVIGQNEDGDYIQFNAAKAVVLATGDYGNDPEMRKNLMPHTEGLVHVYPQKYNTGDGHKMGLWVGGVLDRPPHPGIIHYDPSPLPEGDVAGSGLPWLAVNLLGERFSNEDSSYGTLYAQDMKQPEFTKFQIFDGKFMQDYPHMGKGMMRTEPPLDLEAGIKQGVERGAVQMANTIEELAEKIGVPKDALVATVKRYNELAEKGVDEDFGKKPERLSTIVEPPFYAIKRVAGVLGILGGLKVNYNMQVLDAQRKVIPGLYACGNTSGSFFGGFEHPMRIPGMSLGRATTTGRWAGLNAAKEAA